MSGQAALHRRSGGDSTWLMMMSELHIWRCAKRHTEHEKLYGIIFGTPGGQNGYGQGLHALAVSVPQATCVFQRCAIAESPSEADCPPNGFPKKGPWAPLIWRTPRMHLSWAPWWK
eukprot:9503779-Pyramimonas_sp.AAC.2